MKNIKIYKLLPYLVAGSLTLSGCGSEPSCGITNNSHVHLYTKEINDDITISKYKDSEQPVDFNNFHWNEEYIEINKIDEEFYRELSNNGLFNGIDNFDYLYYEMSNNEDYLEYNYTYTTTETYYTYDDKGNPIPHTKTVEHDDGWTKNKMHSDKTGKVRLCHYMYYSYRLIYKDGRVTVTRCPYEDDIRQHLKDYPYVSLDNSTIEKKTYKFMKYQLLSLDVEDFYEETGHPDLDNTTPNLNNTKSR
jgi:hypothetical protein